MPTYIFDNSFKRLFCCLGLLDVGDNNDSAARVLGNGNQMVKLRAGFVGIVTLTIITDVG